MHRPDLPHQIPPMVDKGSDLVGFPRVNMRDVDQDTEFRIHQPDIRIKLHSSHEHSLVDRECLAGLDDALVGFFGGHGGTI